MTGFLPRLTACLMLAGTVCAAQAALVKSYDFDGSLADTLGNGAAMTASGGTLGAGTYTFAANQGLRLTSALPSTADYAIEMRLRVTDGVGGYNKLIDFQDLTSDLGLYIFSGAISFYTAGGSGAGAVAVGTDYTIGFARAAGIISAYLDGVLLFSAADGNQAVSGTNVLNFFEDDVRTGQVESFAGVVDFIRIHDDASTFGQAPQPMPEPGTLALAGLALLGCTLRRRRG